MKSTAAFVDRWQLDDELSQTDIKANEWTHFVKYT